MSLTELLFEQLEFRSHFAQLRVRQESTQPVQEGKGPFLHECMRPALDQAESLQSLGWQQPFVPQVNQSVTDVVWIEPEVFGPEFLGRPPIADRHADENAFTGERVQDLIMVVVHGFPFCWW